MHTPSSINDLVEQAISLDNRDFEAFLTTVHHERAKQHTKSVDKEEAILLKKINLGFAIEKWERLDFLENQMEFGEISATEHSELTALIDEYEAFSLQRLKNLGKLAAKRNTTLTEVMHQLGIRHESDV